ncbi:CMP-N-acetylneuraminate-beta-galactosamide-alpha-2,3-sialyltransferase 4-like [Porphyrio hochstetteri]
MGKAVEKEEAEPIKDKLIPSQKLSEISQAPKERGPNFPRIEMKFESYWKPFLTSKSLYSLTDRPFKRELEVVLWFYKLLFGLQDSDIAMLFPQHLDKRTSILIFFPESALPNLLEDDDSDTLMVFVLFNPLDFLWLREVLLKTRSKRYATTGIIALNLALHMCQEVNIAGFGYPGNHDNTTPIHYYNTGH